MEERVANSAEAAGSEAASSSSLSSVDEEADNGTTNAAVTDTTAINTIGGCNSNHQKRKKMNRQLQPSNRSGGYTTLAATTATTGNGKVMKNEELSKTSADGTEVLSDEKDDDEEEEEEEMNNKKCAAEGEEQGDDDDDDVAGEKGNNNSSPSSSQKEAFNIDEELRMPMICPPPPTKKDKKKETTSRRMIISTDVRSILDDPETMDWISSPSSSKKEKKAQEEKAGVVFQYRKPITKNLEEEEEEEEREEEEDSQIIPQPSNVAAFLLSLSNTNPLPDGFEPMAMPAPSTNNNGAMTQQQQQQQQQQPGAYAAVPGISLQRLESVPFSLVGVAEQERSRTTMPQLRAATTYPQTTNNRPGAYAGIPANRSLCCRDGQDNNLEEQQQHRSSSITLPDSAASTLPDLDNSDHHHPDDDHLVEAKPVSTNSFVGRSSRWSRAQPVDLGNLDQQQTAREAKEKKYKIIVVCGIVAIACLVLIVSLAVRLTRKNESNSDLAVEAETPTTSPTTLLPPMENLELLYMELPERTKERLNEHNSPQCQAWEWLLNHPNITAYPTWRKKQIFALSTIFYSLEGPNWPETTPARNRWMNVNTSECSWIMTNVEAAYLYQEVTQLIGPDAYEDQDWQPCNKNGEIQMLAFNQIFLPSHLKPTIPPEIRFLTSLKMIGFAFGQINMKFSDLLSEELLQLPHLEGITLSNNGARGTIPKTLGMLTRLRHLLVNANKLSGTIPSEIAMMSSLEYISLGYEEKLFGKLPSELGLMTTLTGLNIYGSSFTGSIATELGSLGRLRGLALDKNKLSGDIPSELGLLTRSTRLSLFENRLNGSLASELGLMTNTLHLRIWNNALTGSIPSEIGLMTNIIDIRLGNDLTQTRPYNNFSGYLPTALWGLSHMEELFLPNLPNLRGQLPSEILMPNLTLLSLSGSQLSGTIPDQVCIFVEELDFDCSDLLCGCGCPCAGSINNTNLP